MVYSFFCYLVRVLACTSSSIEDIVGNGHSISRHTRNFCSFGECVQHCIVSIAQTAITSQSDEPIILSFSQRQDGWKLKRQFSNSSRRDRKWRSVIATIHFYRFFKLFLVIFLVIILLCRSIRYLFKHTVKTKMISTSANCSWLRRNSHSYKTNASLYLLQTDLLTYGCSHSYATYRDHVVSSIGTFQMKNTW
jgi:hypothetical protein